MRTTSHDQTIHNTTGNFFRSPILSLVLAFSIGSLILVAGCGGDANNDQAERGAKSGPVEQANCQVNLDVSAWEDFQTLGNRMSTGERVAAEELEAFGNQRVVTLWRESITDGVPAALRVGNWVEEAFWDSIGEGRTEKKNSDRAVFGKAMRFSYDYRDEINLLLEQYRNPIHLCQLAELTGRWIDKDNLPTPFTINFIAGKPELRSHNGNILVDTSVLFASGINQIDGQIIALIYRDVQSLKGDNPLETGGASAVSHTLRVMMNEGVAGWIEKMPETHFNAKHPRLGKVVIIPEDIFKTGVRALDIFNTNLPRLLNDEDAMRQSGETLARAIVASGALTQGGYCMAAVIAHQLGEDRLVQVCQSPAAFVEAYQEAAKLNTLPLPYPGTAGRELFESMPTFSDEVYQGLMLVLNQAFPQSD